MNSADHKTNETATIALGRSVIITGTLTFTLIIRRVLHNLVGCSACMTVS